MTAVEPAPQAEGLHRVCVMGLGYIGLPTASMLATNGFEVLGVDVSEHVVETVNAGEIHIEEPGLRTLVAAAIGSGNLRAALEPAPADAFIIAVPTPLTPDRRADLQYVEQAAHRITPHLAAGNLVVLESTSPPGACRDVLKPILEQSGLVVGKDIFLAHCPERVLPGNILKELIANDRIIGGYDTQSAEAARALYSRFVEGAIILTDTTTAETVKIIENTYRDVNIALANEIALFCERLGIDYWDAAAYANRHPRVHMLAAGPGVGGHCIPIDPWFLVAHDPKGTQLIQTARARNDAMPEHVVQVIREMLGGQEAPRVAVWGIAYKADVDDLRESPALEVLRLLEAQGIETRVHDPLVRQSPVPLLPLEQTLDGADCILLLSGHSAYKQADPADAARRMRTPRLYDTRHVLEHAAWRRAGFEVRVLGQGAQPEA